MAHYMKEIADKQVKELHRALDHLAEYEPEKASELRKMFDTQSAPLSDYSRFSIAAELMTSTIDYINKRYGNHCEVCRVVVDVVVGFDPALN